jgi:hypothetical protein
MGNILGITILIIGIRFAYKFSDIGRKTPGLKDRSKYDSFFILIFISMLIAAGISSLFD